MKKGNRSISQEARGRRLVTMLDTTDEDAAGYFEMDCAKQDVFNEFILDQRYQAGTVEGMLNEVILEKQKKLKIPCGIFNFFCFSKITSLVATT